MPSNSATMSWEEPYPVLEEMRERIDEARKKSHSPELR